MTTQLPWIPRGTWYLAAVVCAVGCDPDQFVSMGSGDTGLAGSEPASTAWAADGSKGAAPPESHDSAQPDDSSLASAPSSSAPCGANPCEANPCGATAIQLPPLDSSAAGSNNASGGLDVMIGAGGTSSIAAAGATSQILTMPLKL